jgi:hypothetical protein
VTILYRPIDEEINIVIDEVQSLIYDPEKCLFMINGKDNSFTSIQREEVGKLAIYDSVPDFWKEEGGQHDSNL